MTRRSRSEIVDLIRATMPWPDASVEELEPKDAGVYRHRKQALEMYLQGDTIDAIKHATTIDGSFLRKMIKRCLTMAPDGNVYGYRAFLPHQPIKAYIRTKEVDASHWQSGAGLAGVLGATFRRYPGLESRLTALILKRRSKGKKSKEIHEFAIRAVDVHVAFIGMRRENNHPAMEWPYNTKSLGIRGLTTYIKQVREQNYERTIHISGDRGAIAHIPVGTGIPSLTKSTGLMSAIEIDAYTYDAIFILILQHENGLETYHVLKKLHLLAAVDSLTTATLWYYVVHGDDVSAESVVTLIRKMLSANLQKPEFTIQDLAIEPGAGFPMEVIPEMTQVLPSIIRLDNALAHLANKVSSDLRKQIGCVIEYGVPGRPERRPSVEHKFKRFAADLIQRFPNTTGAGPLNGRAVNPEGAAIEFMITSDELDQLTYAFFANLNAEPSAGLRFLSPLATVEQLVRKDHYIPRRPPIDMQHSLGLVRASYPRTVKGGVEDGHRPYINFKKARYTSPALARSPQLVGEPIIIKVNEVDIRVVDAYLKTGASIGPLTVQGDWAEHPHSLKVRDIINSLISRQILHRVTGECIVTTYFRYLEGNLKAAAKKNKQDPKSATKLDALRAENHIGIHAEELKSHAAPQIEPDEPKKHASIPEREYIVPPGSIDLIELVKKL
ncbi:hypothetical protein [Pseudomonas sp.]|uniref:hypothetical protein n=1 Tax=Pseudomonas sp. TaxID=306 RepID=UPI00289966F5|nr:hypothetical protein [Pseudomonas sp.]